MEAGVTHPFGLDFRVWKYIMLPSYFTIAVCKRDFFNYIILGIKQNSLVVSKKIPCSLLSYVMQLRK